jgi:hypothetical protein
MSSSRNLLWNLEEASIRGWDAAFIGFVGRKG